MLSVVKNSQEENVLLQILEKVPEVKDWITKLTFHYPDGQMEVILNEIPELLARK